MRFYNPRGSLGKTRHRLPHWQQDGVPLFITFRLSDAMPRAVLERWEYERGCFRAAHPLPWSAETQQRFDAEIGTKFEEALDAGHGSCALGCPAVANIVVERLHHFDGQRYDLAAYVIMPNHVHLLVTLRAGGMLPETVQGWKGVSSRLIRQQGLPGPDPFWQPDYWDRLICDHEHLAQVKSYIRHNPANLRDGFVLWERPAG